jgi:GNAT superfamily N-acetyltransferase
MLEIRIVPAVERDCAVILEMIRELAEYEKLSHMVTATEDRIRESLFGPKPVAEVLLAQVDSECAGFALFFATYSTFLAQPGLYLEDLYVKPHLRAKGIGRALLRHLASLARQRGCGRLEWEVLDWNAPSIGFYRTLGAVPVGGWTRYRLTGDALMQVAGDATMQS